jgi:flagellar biosynthesis protein FlhF
MKLKSYFSESVEAAVELARKELGADALLVNARPASPETRHLGAYEIVFGVAPGLEPAKVAATTPDRLTHDVAEMRREIERLGQCLRGGQGLLAAALAPASGSREAELYAQLVANELDAMIAQAVAQGSSIEDFFEVDSGLGRPRASRGVIALVGPPGAGKTTTLVKLAARYGLASKKPSQILSADVHRIAAADQLRSLASILGIGCDVVETPVALAQALEEHRAKELVFIDTPGLARAEMEDGAELARLIGSHPEIDTHLVLPASMKPMDMAAVIDRYQVFQPSKLLFTRIDETERYGALVSEAARRSLPVSFLATGQQIPDDLEPATKVWLAALALGSSASTPRTLGASA